MIMGGVLVAYVTVECKCRMEKVSNGMLEGHITWSQHSCSANDRSVVMERGWSPLGIACMEKCCDNEKNSHRLGT